MDVQAASPSDGEAAELVQQSEALPDDVAQLAQPLDALAVTGRNDGCAAALPAGVAYGAAFVSRVGQQHREAAARPPGPAGDRLDAVEQRHGLGDIADVRAGGGDVQRGAVALGDQVVLAARLAAVDRRRPDASTPFFASM
jgi:hypothetical protein